MKLYTLSLFLIFISGCSFAEKYESLDLEGKMVSLNTSKCYVNYDSKDIHFGSVGNCFFVKENNSEKIRMKYYKDIDSYVFLIVGDMLSKDPEYPLTMQREDCGSTVKALIINKKEAIVSINKFTNTVTCAGIGSDEKEFYFLSH